MINISRCTEVEMLQAERTDCIWIRWSHLVHMSCIKHHEDITIAILVKNYPRFTYGMANEKGLICKMATLQFLEGVRCNNEPHHVGQQLKLPQKHIRHAHEGKRCSKTDLNLEANSNLNLSRKEIKEKKRNKKEKQGTASPYFQAF